MQRHNLKSTPCHKSNYSYYASENNFSEYAKLGFELKIIHTRVLLILIYVMCKCYNFQ
jgi:hypothetical protein